MLTVNYSEKLKLYDISGTMHDKHIVTKIIDDVYKHLINEFNKNNTFTISADFSEDILIITVGEFIVPKTYQFRKENISTFITVIKHLIETIGDSAIFTWKNETIDMNKFSGAAGVEVWEKFYSRIFPDIRKVSRPHELTLDSFKESLEILQINYDDHIESLSWEIALDGETVLEVQTEQKKRKASFGSKVLNQLSDISREIRTVEMTYPQRDRIEGMIYEFVGAVKIELKA